MGNTYRLKYRQLVSEDHPHIYGEYRVGYFMGNDIQGSPPYIWGILHFPEEVMAPSRITPIYMGNTRSADYTNMCNGDHPHIYGEYYIHRLTYFGD